MDFLSRYEDMQSLPESETKAFRARETATERSVLLHQLSSNPRSGMQLHLLALVLRYSSSPHPEGQNPILAIEEQGDSLWVVTEDKSELVNLWEWMERQSAKPPASPETDSASGVPSERTARFARRLATAGSNPLVEFAATENESARGGEAEPLSGAANNLAEKTQTFPASRPGEAEADAAPNVAPPAPDTLKPGEFTAIFQRPSAEDSSRQLDVQPDAQPAAPPKTEPALDEKPGEFTMLFRKPPAGAGADQKPRFMGFTAPTTEKARFIETVQFKTEQPIAQEMPPAEPQKPGASNPPGDFTVMFKSSQPAAIPAQRDEPPVLDSFPPAEPQKPGATNPPGDFTVMFKSPQPAAIPAQRDEPPVLDSFPPVESEHNANETPTLVPGEFTQVFQGGPAGSETLRPGARPDEPGAFTRIFQIPVGSDLLTSAEQQTVFSGTPSAAPPPFEAQVPVAPSPISTPMPPPAPVPAPASPPPGGGAGFQIKAPAIPAIPAAPQAPKIEIPQGGGAAAPKLPSFSVPKPPSVSLPKTPKLPGIENPAAVSGPSVLPLILVFGGIVLIAVLLVLFFVTKH